jgi:multisubunit Na+/H+ antiporter MnhG subunit
MTTIQIVALLVAPVGALALGAAAYWIAAREDDRTRSPAE